MDSEKQKLLLEYLISSPDTFALCKSIVKSEYFDPEYRKAVDFIHNFYDDFSNTPPAALIKAETGAELQHQEVSKDLIEYAAREIEQFCRRRAVQLAVLRAPKMIAEGDYGVVEQMIKDAVSVSLNRELGLNYFDNPLERLQQLAAVPQRTPVLGGDFDEAIAGGLARTEILMFSANSGGGKSITLSNVALNFLCTPKFPGSDQKMDVLYVSFELSEEMVAQRFDSMFSGIPTVRWREAVDTIVDTVSNASQDHGRLTIKRFPTGTNCNTLRAYLKEFELKNGYIPDLLVIDYLDIMGPNEHVSADNVFEKDKRTAEQLRDILFDYNMFCVTASQQNREAMQASTPSQSHIAGGISKINTVDWYVSIIMNPVLKAAGEIMFAFLKTRSSDGVGKQVLMKWEHNSLRIKPIDKQPDPGIAQFQKKADTQPKKLGLLDSFVVDYGTQQP